MEKYRNAVRCLAFLSGFVWTMGVLFALSCCPGQSMAAPSAIPEGKILFEDRQARIVIVKTTAGVILQISTDEQGRVTVKELESEPAPSAGTRSGRP